MPRPPPADRAARAAGGGLFVPEPDARTYGYVRVSTTRQADDGESLDVQQRQIEGYAQMLGLTLERVFVERGVSGSKPFPERPEGGALIGVLRPGDAVITAKLDRMFRSAFDALGLMTTMKGANIALHMIDLGGDVTTNGGNMVSKLVFTILSAVAEAERDRTRERISETKRDQRGRGRYLGGKIPFGWRLGDAGDLVEVPEQQQAIRRIRKLRGEGLSLRRIAKRLKDDGVAISHEGVRKALDMQEAA